jgi:LysR family transcriptional regulator (chromosome initiation inhibitor)
MELDAAQLRALGAVVSEGTFEAAARRLSVTPSAISQRIRALENAIGRVLLTRSKPVEPTESGLVLLRLARQIELLSGDAAHELGAPDDAWLAGGEQGNATGDGAGADSGGGPLRRPVVVPLAVNADSMSTWLLPALAGISGQIAFDLHREDQGHTTELLRAGTVMAAVTDAADPVQGCSSTPLGVMRYRPMASPAFAARWFAGSPGTPSRAQLGRAPMVVFDRRDRLQDDYLRLRDEGSAGGVGPGAAPADPPRHYVPASVDFVQAVALGFGWGMVPELQAAGHDLVPLDPDTALDVPLYWQQWQLRTPSLDLVASTVEAAARRALRPFPRGR